MVGMRAWPARDGVRGRRPAQGDDKNRVIVCLASRRPDQAGGGRRGTFPDFTTLRGPWARKGQERERERGKEGQSNAKRTHAPNHSASNEQPGICVRLLPER